MLSLTHVCQPVLLMNNQCCVWDASFVSFVGVTFGMLHDWFGMASQQTRHARHGFERTAALVGMLKVFADAKNEAWTFLPRQTARLPYAAVWFVAGPYAAVRGRAPSFVIPSDRPQSAEP